MKINISEKLLSTELEEKEERTLFEILQLIIKHIDEIKLQMLKSIEIQNKEKISYRGGGEFICPHCLRRDFHTHPEIDE